MNPRAVRWWQWLICAALCVFVAMYARAVPWSAVMNGIRSASPAWLAMAAAAFLLGVAIRGVLWWLFLRQVDAPSLYLAVRGMVLVTALHCVVVANAGEAGRVLLITRRSGARAADVVATIALERLIVTGMHVLASIAVGVLVPLPASLARWRTVFMILLAALGVVVAVLSRSRGKLGGVALTLRRIAAPGRVVAAGLLGAVWWCLNLATFHWTAIALGLHMPLTGTAIAFLMVSAGNAAHATPGNVGVLQVVYASTAHLLGVPTEQAIGVALVAQAVQSLPVMVVSLPVVREMFTVWRQALPYEA